MSKKKEVKFPKTLFIKVENPNTDEEYLATAIDIAELAEIGEIIPIAEYQLVKVQPVKVQQVQVKINWNSLKEN